MALNFNVDPYYDDFDDAKNFHRILFKPGKAVQARELTQAQTILQDQITKFANNIFKENSPVTGGQITTNFNSYYIKLQSTYNSVVIDVADFEGLLLTNADGTVVARVIATAPATGTAGEGDPPTLIVVYKSGTQFKDNDIIFDVNSNKACQAITNSSTGQSSVVSIAKGVFFVLGNFVQIEPTTIILSKYDNTPSKRVGLEITETIYDFANDSSLLDPAVGASNYQAPGADRYVISLTLTTKPLYFGDDELFIELLRIEDGNVFKMVDGSVYAVIDDYFAKRDYETNGDYIVEDFKLTPKVNDADEDTYIMNVGKGLAYVRGYRVENPAPLNITSNRSRTTSSINNDTTVLNYGSYFIVSGVVGANAKTFDVTTSNTVDFHCVTASSVVTTNTSTYNSTLVAKGYIRGLDFQSSPTNSDANTYIYKAFVYDLQNQSLSGLITSANSIAVVLPATNGKTSSVNDAYVGVDISITSGTNAGETRTIIGYVGSTRTATVNKAWSVTPDATSSFVLNFDTTDIESIIQADTSSYPATIYGKAKINDSGKQNSLTSGDTIFENPNKPELIFPIGLPYVSDITDASYTTYLQNRSVTFGVSGSTLSATLPLSGSYLGLIKHRGTENTTLTSDLVEENFTIIVTSKGSNSKFDVGDIVPWTISGRSIALNSDLSLATLTTTTSDLSAFTATILYKVTVPVATNSSVILKIKNLVSANANTVVATGGTQVNTYTYVDDSVSSTGQIYIEKNGVANPGVKQSLYLSDVKRIWKIIDTKSSGTAPITSMFTNPTYDVTTRYLFDDGQRDGYYDHASITLKPGAAKPTGNLLVLVDYYKHSGGDGYFNKRSYIDISNSPDDYREIPTYTSKNGTTYSLRDCLDFRPARQNAQANFVFRYSNPSDTRFGALIPVDSSSFVCDYSYYLGRKDKLILTKDKSLQIIEGSPSLNPLLPNEPDGCLVLASITHRPYTSYVPTELVSGLSDLSIEQTQHRRYTMSDIAGLDTRINRIEYYTALNVLEQNANALQISDAYGLNRFKNGIMVDDFSGYSASEANITDFNASVNRRTKRMTASQTVTNYPLKNLALVYNMNNPSPSYISSLNFYRSTNGFTNYFMLPYTSTNMASQKLASRKVNLNPFSVSNAKGTISLSPNVDNWVDTTYSPSLLITDPNLHIWQGSDTISTLSAGDWQTVSGTSTLLKSTSSVSSSTRNVPNHGAFNGPFGTNVGYTERVTETTTTTTYKNVANQTQNNLLGKYTQLDNTYSLNNGYVTDISILPWMRKQEIAITATNMLYKTQVFSFFDTIGVDNYVRKTNIIELTNVTGTFKQNDVIGYYSSGTFTPTGVVIGIYDYPTSNNMRLYVAGDGKTTTYHNGLVLQNANFNGDGVYQGRTAYGNFDSQTHSGGLIRTVGSTTSITLSSLATTSNTTYVGQTLYVTSGTGQGSSATITAYNGVTKVATLGTAITCAVNDIYSIGTFVTNEEGSFYGIFTVPANTFHTGTRVFRMDNRINGNEGTITTFAEGSFYAQGLQTNKQNIDFGASPAGAKDTFTQVNKRDVVTQSTQAKVTKSVFYTPYDPVAQTFIIDAANYPNGAYISSVRLFFSSKPATDTAPVTLSIVGTLNGYPNGTTLDNSIVTLPAYQIKVSNTPQYLDSTTYTEFLFDSPVYIQAGTLYSFIVKSSSNEYNLWTASNGDTALASSVKNLPTDPYPSSITKISTAPYVGSLFLSQNSQTWTADQNQSMMFTIERAKFDTSKTPSIRMVVPKKLPQRTLLENKVDYYSNANNMTNTIGSVTNTNSLIDAFNVTTTDFIPSSTSINYNYSATLQTGASTSAEYINPGKYGTTMYDHIYLDDNQGERLLNANSDTSFSLYAQLSSTDDAVSPILSDAGTSLFAIQYNINNCELSNSLIAIVSGGTQYATGNTTVSISAPTGQNGQQAYATPVIVGGVITEINFTNTGSGYIETPTVSINVSGGSASGASAIIAGETSKNGGPAATRYITKKVVLDAGFDSGDLNVYISAYRPVNTDILVYYKILNRNDTQSFDDSSWQLMNKTKNSNTLYSKNREDLNEFTFAPGTGGVDQGYVSYQSTNNGQIYNTFNQFAIKIVLVTTDKTSVPFLTDMRCIALPSNINSVLG